LAERQTYGEAGRQPASQLGSEADGQRQVNINRNIDEERERERERCRQRERETTARQDVATAGNHRDLARSLRRREPRHGLAKAHHPGAVRLGAGAVPSFRLAALCSTQGSMRPLVTRSG
jgi:hypothetical protein